MAEQGATAKKSFAEMRPVGKGSLLPLVASQTTHTHMSLALSGESVPAHIIYQLWRTGRAALGLTPKRKHENQVRKVPVLIGFEGKTSNKDTGPTKNSHKKRGQQKDGDKCNKQRTLPPKFCKRQNQQAPCQSGLRKRCPNWVETRWS